MNKIISLLLLLLMQQACVWAEELTTHIGNLDSDDYAVRATARAEIKNAPATASESTRPALLKELADSMTAENSFPVRFWSFRMLELFGDDTVVSALAGQLADTDAKIQDQARRALQAIPSPQATRALEQALSEAPDGQKAAYMDALAYRADVGSVPLVASFLNSDHSDLQERAALTLGKISGSKAEAALLNQLSSAPKSKRLTLELALIDAGISDAEVAKKLAANGSNTAVKLGAFEQLIRLSGSEAWRIVDIALNDESYPDRATYLKLGFDDDPLQRKIADQLLGLPYATQKILLGFIMDRELSQYESTVLGLLGNTSELPQRELVEALGVIGSDQSYSALYTLYVNHNGDKTIKQALSRINAPSADAALLRAAADNNSSREQIGALELLTLRNTQGAIELINQLASQGADSQMERVLFKSMEVIGNPASVAVLLKIILENGDNVRAAQGALKKLSVSLGDAAGLWSGYYEPALKSASEQAGVSAILAILDGVACAGSLDYLRNLITNQPALRNDAMKSLSRWNDISAGDVWLAVATDPAASEQEVADALQGLKRLLTQTKIAGIANRKFKLAVKAIQQAPSLEFKQEILSCYEGKKISKKDRSALKKNFKPLLQDPEIAEQVNKILGE